jgi:hypothetical protein
MIRTVVAKSGLRMWRATRKAFACNSHVTKLSGNAHKGTIKGFPTDLPDDRKIKGLSLFQCRDQLAATRTVLLEASIFDHVSLLNYQDQPVASNPFSPNHKAARLKCNHLTV